MTEEWRCAASLLVLFVPIIGFYLIFNYIKNHGQLSRVVKIVSIIALIFIIGGILFYLLPKWLWIGIFVFLLLLLWISLAIQIWDWQYSHTRKKLHIWYDKRKAVLIVNGILILCVVFFIQDQDYHLHRTDDTIVAVQEQLLSYLKYILLSSLAVSQLLLGLPNNLIIEDGVYIPLAGVVKWADILSYRWESKKENMLTLKVKRNLRIWGEISLPIAPEYRNRVRKLLQEYRS
jgi:hypothetical protein